MSSFPPEKLQVCQGWEDPVHSKPSLQPLPATEGTRAASKQHKPRKVVPKHQHPTCLKVSAFHSSLPLPPASDPTPQAPSPFLAATSSKQGMCPGRKGPGQGKQMPGQTDARTERGTELGEPNPCCLATRPPSLPQLHCAEHLSLWWSYTTMQCPQGASRPVRLTPHPWSGTLNPRRL